MATWRDHPQWQRGYLWVHKPTVVFAAQLHYTNTTTYGKNATNTNIWNYLFFQNVTVGDSSASDVREGMTLLLGTTAGAYDLGRVRVKQVVNVNPPDAYALKVWASNNIHDGEVYPQSGAYITVLDQYLPWFKPPYYGIGSGYVDGDLGPGGATHSQFPIANAGPGYVGFDPGEGGVHEADYSGGSTGASQRSDLAPNLFDGDDGTYWNPVNFGTSFWFSFMFPVSKRIESYGIKPRFTTSAPTHWTLDGSTNGSSWITIDARYDISWPTTNEQTFDVATPGNYTYYRLTFNRNGESFFPYIGEFNLYEPEVKNWITLSGADSYATAYDAVLGAYGADITGDATSVTATSEYSGNVAANAVDDNNGTFWRADTASQERLELGFAAKRKVRKITITPENTARSPKTFMLIGENPGQGQVILLSLVDITTGWRALTPRTFYIDYQYPEGGFTSYELYIVSINGGVRVSVAEFEMMEEDRATAYSWDVGDGSIVSGTSSSEEIDVTFPAGFRYVHLTVTDSSSYEGIKHVPVVLVDPDAYTDVVRNFEVIGHTITQAGQSMTFRIHEALDLDDYPPLTMVMYWEDESVGGESGSLAAAGPTGREHIKFIGYLDVENTRIQAGEFDTETGVELQCVDIGGRLRQMPAFQFVAERADSVSYIYEMEHANMDRLIYLLVRWFSTAAEIADFFWTYELDQWGFPILSTEAGNLYDSIDDRAQAIAHRFTCDKHGRLWVLPDPQLQPVDDRTSTVIVDIDETDWQEVNYTYRRGSRYHWQWSSAIQISTLGPDSGVSPLFAVGPGPAPGQGVASIEQGEQLVKSFEATDFFEREGHRYALRTQAPFNYFDVKLAHGADTGIDPARMAWVRMTISAATAAQRGYAFTDARFLPIEARIDYDHEAMTKTVSLVLEKEVIGKPLTQYTPPE